MMSITNEEWKHMKYLKIENNKGLFLKIIEEVETWVEIDKITKEDLWNLLDKAISNEFEMDNYSENEIAHKAHQIVYKSLYEKFDNLLANKSKFIDECDSQYKNAVEKYEQASEQ